MMSRTTITVSSELKEKLSLLKKDKTWDEFLTELLEKAMESRVESLERFLRETSSERDIPFERVRLRLKEDESAPSD